MSKNETEETQANNRGRQVAATAASVAVTVVIGVATQVLTSRISALVASKINPE